MNSISVEFTQDDLTTIAQLLDVAVKASGLQGAKPALAILAKLEAAVTKANATNATDTEEGTA